MKKNLNISILPGDGIGKEISDEAIKIINWASKKFDLSIKLKEEYIGGISIDMLGTPLSDETLERIKQSDAIILGAVGGPKWENLEFEKRKETSKIRKELDLFANFGPAFVLIHYFML